MLFLFVTCSKLFAYTTVNLTQIDTDQGLNQSEIIGLMQDSQGYIWINTLQGINRFDGYRVTNIPSPDNILTNHYIEMAFEDSFGLIWLGVAPENNYYLDKEKNQLIPVKLIAPDDYKLEFAMFNRAVEDEHSNIWFATYQEIFYFDRQSNTFHFILPLNSLFKNENYEHSIRHLLLVEDYLLIATSNELFALNLQNNKTHRVLHTDQEPQHKDQINVKYLHKNQHGKILVGTVAGLYEIDPKAITMADNEQYSGRKIVSDLNIWKIIEKNDFYYLATDQGLYKLFKNGQLEFIFKYSDTKFNTSDDDIVAMIEDNEGNLWFGSKSDGVFKWRPNDAISAYYWTGNQSGYQLTNDVVFSITRTNKDTIWIGTQNGLNKVDENTGQVTQLLFNKDEKATYSDSTIFSMVKNQNELWLNTAYGIRVFDSQSLKEVNKVFPEELKTLFKKPIYSIYFINQETLVLFNDTGMYLYNIHIQKLNLVESTETKGDIRAELFDVFSTATGKRNTYFLAGVDRLVKYSFDTGLITPFHSLSQNKSSMTGPADLYRDGNKLWVTYSNFGIFVLDAETGKEIKFFSEEELGVNTAMDIFPDKHGNLWFTANNGLLRINKLNYQARLFNSKDGFATSEFNGKTKLVLDEDNVFLGSVKGAVRFSPNKLINRKSRKISTHITGVSLITKPIDYLYSGFDNHKITMAHDDFGLKLEFSALLFDKPKQVKYKYWIEGVSSIQPTTLEESELFLASFNPGKAVINISAIDYETGEESPPTQLTILTKPAPWLSTTAYLTYLLIITIIASIYFHRLRIRNRAREIAHQKLKHSEERLNLALQGSNSGLWDWHADDNSIYEPRLAHKNNEIIPFNDRMGAIHPEDREEFKEAWETFLAQGKAVFNHVYRMKNNSDNWIWYRDMATVSKRNIKNRAIRVTGTYTNITKSKRDRDRMRLYSKAFENTRDIVFVLDEYRNLIAANQSFYKKTNKTVNETIGNKVDFIIDNNGSDKLIDKIFKNIEAGSHWESEGNLILKNYREIPVIINASSFTIGFRQENYVFALTDISKQKAAEAELRKLANYDLLTGLPNRTLLLDRVKHAIDHCRRKNKSIAILFVDLDRFKRINDTLGHDIGDLLLSKVARILFRAVREDDTVARIGGDEFVIVLEDLQDLSAISHVAQDVIEKMKEPIRLNENQIAISPSIGISIYPNDGENPEQLLKHADIAMYHAKKAGRNNFQFYEITMNLTAHNRLMLENKLREGLLNDEFYLVYQPQYDILTGQIKGMEGLARWRTASGEEIPPTEFIPLAEELGLIITMSEKLLTQALSNLSAWHESGLHIGMALNLSARHLHHYELIHFLDELLVRYPINPNLLEFELTESVLMEDTSRVQSLFEKLAQKGIELALDDFGTGYSSLRYLSQLPIKKLKIDRSFVSKVGESSNDEAIIRTIISLAKSLKLKTVAEGIETKEQLEFLRNAGAQVGQGYYYSKPLSLFEIEMLIRQEIIYN
ncbi:EAL domain-containing protein [Aliikangiella maris]|uniref:EAL domain-containing protein n=2 Tax=Aliikangiella maris TaxID=3162458 RepID=A0ABV2BZD2_9GAMM